MPSSSPFQQSSILRESHLVQIENLRSIWVSEVMSRDPVTVKMNDRIEEAFGLMRDNQIRHLPVLDRDGNIQGVLSDRDLLKDVGQSKPWVLQEKMLNLRSHHFVRDFMTPTPEVINPDSTLFEAGLILLENKISCVPVVEGNQVVGILTETDFVKLICGDTLLT